MFRITQEPVFRLAFHWQHFILRSRENRMGRFLTSRRLRFIGRESRRSATRRPCLYRIPNRCQLGFFNKHGCSFFQPLCLEVLINELQQLPGIQWRADNSKQAVKEDRCIGRYGKPSCLIHQQPKWQLPPVVGYGT